MRKTYVEHSNKPKLQKEVQELKDLVEQSQSKQQNQASEIAKSKETANFWVPRPTMPTLPVFAGDGVQNFVEWLQRFETTVSQRWMWKIN